MAKEKVKPQPKKDGHSVYTFNQDYDLGGKVKGDFISLGKVPRHLTELLVETATGKGLKKTQVIGDLPDPEKATKAALLEFLHNNGVAETETRGLSKEDLLPLLSPFYK